MEFHLLPLDARVTEITSSARNNENFSLEAVDTFLKAAFESGRTYGLFNMYFDEELYRYAAFYYANNTFGRIRYLNTVVGTAKVLEDVELSNRNLLPYRDVRRFLEKDFSHVRI